MKDQDKTKEQLIRELETLRGEFLKATGTAWNKEHQAVGPDGKICSDTGRKLPVNDQKAGELPQVDINRDSQRLQIEDELRESRDEQELRARERTIELKETMEKLRAERQRFHDVLDALPVYVVLLTPEYQVPFANQVFRERFGESTGLRCYEHLFGYSEPCKDCSTFKVLETMTPYQWEWEGPDGCIYEVFDFPFTDSDGSTKILEMGIDITGRKRAEAELEKYRNQLEELVKERTDQLEAANARLQMEIADRRQMEEELRRSKDELELRVLERTAELSASNRILTEYAVQLERLNEELQEFAFVASHDLQEPLRKIQTFGDMLSERYRETLGAQGRDYLLRMIKAANRMSDSLRSLLGYSRIATRPNQLEPIDLGRVIEEALSDLETIVARSGGRVEFGPLPTIEGDAAQLRELFHHLLKNSLIYCRECEEPVVRISCSESSGMCRIFVEDNGVGFQEEYVDRIFKPFQRLHTQNASYEGTGMGLAICRKIVERHRGNITARSTPGQGATFIVSLPIKQNKQRDI